MIDHRETQELKAEREGRPFIEKATLEQFRSKTKTYPAGSVFLWAAEKVYGPPEDKRNRA